MDDELARALIEEIHHLREEMGLLRQLMYINVLRDSSRFIDANKILDNLERIQPR
jgi:hypothetical protein